MPNADEASSFEGIFQDVSCNWLPRDFQAKEFNIVSELVPALKIRVPVPERPLKKTTKKHALVHLPQVFN